MHLMEISNNLIIFDRGWKCFFWFSSNWKISLNYFYLISPSYLAWIFPKALNFIQWLAKSIIIELNIKRKISYFFQLWSSMSTCKEGIYSSILPGKVTNLLLWLQVLLFQESIFSWPFGVIDMNRPQAVCHKTFL